jgi:tetratricopeptide (TPR) repeat protein
MRRLPILILCLFVAVTAEAHGDLDVQVDAVTRAIAARPNDAALYLKRAELHREHRDWETAAADYDRARALAPRLAAIDLCRGRMLLESGRVVDAIPVLERYLKQAPNDAHGVAYLARALSSSNRSKDAARAWDRALSLTTTDEPSLPDWKRWRDDARRDAGLPARSARSPMALPKPIVTDPAPHAPNPTARLLRGPYLQQPTPDSIVIRWRTDLPTDSVVGYGEAPLLGGRNVKVRTRTLDHEVKITNLVPGTRYVYAIGSTSQVLAFDSSTTFRTPPPVGTSSSTRIWVLGDSGTANPDAEAVRDAFVSYTEGRTPDVWLMLGDNAYDSGLDSEYQRAVFDLYAAMLPRVALWSTLGNHDGYSADSGTQSGPYYEIFTLPRGGEAGGVASATEAYYSFDHANIHFVCLDSYGSDRSAGSPMLDWLERDLAANRQPWVIAFWHHPPYSKGSHDSDWEAELYEMRENALPILEAFGVDLVLSGHSHSYERSYLIDGHYGVSSTFGPSNLIDGGAGSYTKPDVAGAAHAGAVYAVAGSSGQISGGSLDHPAMHVSLNRLGSMVLDVDGGVLEAIFLDEAGAVADRFSIRK